MAIGLAGLSAVVLFVARKPYQLAAPIALVLAGGCVFCGWGVARGRVRAATAGIGVGGVSFLLGTAWVVLTLINGVLSLIALAVVPLSGLSTVLIAMVLDDLKRIDMARKRLRAQGLDAGL